MKIKPLYLIIICLIVTNAYAQNDLPTDYLSSDFHKERRESLRASMPENSVAIFFSNPIRNRANDMNYMYHQDANFYYLSGLEEPHSMLLIFSEPQTKEEYSFNELIYVRKRDAYDELWNGVRLGVEGVKNKLSFNDVYANDDFKNTSMDFTTFSKVLFYDFENDVRDMNRGKTENLNTDLFALIEQFKTKINYETPASTIAIDDNVIDVTTNIDVKSLSTLMANLREIKTKEELVLLKKACEISAVGQIEIMKAMNPNLSEREIQGVHEFVYKKYGAEYEGYPSIVGAGSNGCVLHYFDNLKTRVGDELVLMDLGAEYHGYTADVTRTIPANGKYSKEQRAIYDLVYEAQEAGIAKTVIGSTVDDIDAAGRIIINKGLIELGIIETEEQGRKYFPHGTSHHVGLEVHDLSNYGPLQENMFITVEPGIYIPEGSDCDEKWWGIAVRIEDCILVTKNEPINYSGMAPRKSEEIEEMMKEESILNAFHLPNLD